MSFNSSQKPYPAFLLLAFLTVGCIIPGLRAGKGSHFTYLDQKHNQDNPDSDWNNGNCVKQDQSPIDIDRNYGALPINSTIDWTESRKNYDFKAFILKNTGHSIELQNFKTVTGQPPTFAWPARGNSVYQLEQIHFHWGESDNNGSEHALGGKKYPLEMHMVHYRSSGGPDGGFESMDDGVKKHARNGAFSVIGFFFEVDDNEPTTVLDSVVSHLHKVIIKNDRRFVDGIEMKMSELLQLQTQAVTYMGSSTTPPCFEQVAWLVTVTKPVKIKKDVLEQLRYSIMEGGKPLTWNFRRLQDIDGRRQQLVKFEQ